MKRFLIKILPMIFVLALLIFTIYCYYFAENAGVMDLNFDDLSSIEVGCFALGLSFPCMIFLLVFSSYKLSVAVRELFRWIKQSRTSSLLSK